MKLFTIFFSLLLLLGTGFCAEADTAPPAINAHFSWCDEPKTIAAKLKRFEEFWKERHPENDDAYDDSPHVTYVRRCAYRLAALYAQTGQKEKCLNMLKWLQKTDDSLPENAVGEAAPAK